MPQKGAAKFVKTICTVVSTAKWPNCNPKSLCKANWQAGTSCVSMPSKALTQHSQKRIMVPGSLSSSAGCGDWFASFSLFITALGSFKSSAMISLAPLADTGSATEVRSIGNKSRLYLWNCLFCTLMSNLKRHKSESGNFWFRNMRHFFNIPKSLQKKTKQGLVR